MSILAGFAVVLIAVAVIVAAAAKMVDVDASKQSLESLHIPQEMARRLAPLVPAVELAVAAVWVIFPGVLASQITLVVLFGLFATAAALALLRGEQRACACFGSLDRTSRLGWRQIMQLFAVVGMVAAVRYAAPAWAAREGMVIFGCCVAAAAALHLLSAGPGWQSVRADRISLMDARIAAKRMAAGVSNV